MPRGQPAAEPAGDAPSAPIKAAGKFPSADRIPRNYHLVAYPLDDHVSDNQIDYKYEDYLLLGVDNWQERITESVALYEYAETIDEIIRTSLPALEATLDEILGKDYDFTELYALVRSEGAATARRLASLLYQACPESRAPLTQQQQLGQLKDILAVVGFQLPLNAKGDGVDDEKAEATAREFFISVCMQHVRLRASGEHLTVEVHVERQVQPAGTRLVAVAEGVRIEARHRMVPCLEAVPPNVRHHPLPRQSAV